MRVGVLARGEMDADDQMRENVPYLDHFQCHFDIALVVHLGGKRTPAPSMLRLRAASAEIELSASRVVPAILMLRHA